jgi:ribosomal protein S18 acetylase RimI-like enzyme
VPHLAVALDNPIWSALTGPQARFGEVRGHAARYRADVSPFTALAGPDGWDDLAALAGPGAEVWMSGPFLDPPPGWTVLGRTAGVQMVGTGLHGAPDPEAVGLTTADVPEILDLVARTGPGPFRARTVEVGRYRGLRRDGRLIAMAGERIRVPGFTEISAVCTDPAYRGRGLAARLMRAVAAGIRERGDTPFLASLAANETALRLYARLGFEERARVTFARFRTPA